MNELDRLTVYSVLCFMCFCSLVLRPSYEVSLLPIVGMLATIFGIWFETRYWRESSNNHQV
ncbi:hypothetical protein GTG28_19125 [Vibrio sp. OCN044]|uniref:Uncharacterized protein n=1 Tax=Vibrio tetraodonis subsp. pristinus TaxID=2695891 RepID=A0A6L8M5P5_9VIBR|nr:hypothetical protein [Vibrio tetraodonis]MYM61332.1 hypothetical protein [Vibrio tetraodonis subsp. pristinus]